MAFKLLFDFRIHQDIEKSIDYYIDKSPKAASNFYNAINDAYDLLEVNPFFQIRYKDYRCLPIIDFPFMLHFSVNEKQKTVCIHALINTSKDPKVNWLK